MPKKDLKVIILPDGDEIVERCAPLFTDGKSPWLPLLVKMGVNVDFMPHLHKLGGRELVGPGVVMALSLALYDFNDQSVGEYPPLVKGVLIGMIPEFVMAIVDDKEVVADAMEIIAAVEEKMAK